MNYRSISHSEALTFREATDEFGTSWVVYRGVPEILGRLLYDICLTAGSDSVRIVVTVNSESGLRIRGIPVGWRGKLPTCRSI